MFLIFGWRTIAQTISSGEFSCPGCGQDQLYETKSYRRWFTLFFIPVIPLNDLGEAVVCTACESEYEIGVLSIPTRRQMLQAYYTAVRSVVAGMSRLDESKNLFPAAQQLTDGLDGYDIKAMEADIQTLSGYKTIEAALGTFAAMSNENGRARIIECAIFLATQDGDITEAELNFILQVGLAVGMSQPFVQGMISAYLAPKATDVEGGTELDVPAS